MINSIVMKNFAVYGKKTALSDCRKINLVYGKNGTGKTILSNYLKEPDAAEYTDFSIVWDDEGPSPIYVFNKKFCDETFGITNIPGIYTLGHENTTVERKADEISACISVEKNRQIRLQKEYDVLNDQRAIHETVCIDSLWDRGKTYKQLIGDYFKRPGSKLNCFNKVLNETIQGKKETPSLFELKQKADVLNSSKETEYSLYQELDASDLVSIEDDPVWFETIQTPAGRESETNKMDVKAVEWIHQGLQYLDEKDECPFCGQMIQTEAFTERMNRVIPDDQGQKTDLCGKLLPRYESLVQSFLTRADRILRKNRDEGSAFIDTNLFSDTLTNLRNLLHSNILFMQRKKENYLLEVNIQTSRDLSAILNRLIRESNDYAVKANKMLADLRKSKTELQKEAWISFCWESKDDINVYKSAVSGISMKMEQIQQQIEQIDKRVRDLESDREKIIRSSVNIRNSIDRINSELTLLGIDNFHLRLSDDEKHYNIVRDRETPASETISEGEKTLIMLLYFLQMADGSAKAGNTEQERIIVIDDPVSNLDDVFLDAVLGRIGILISQILDGDKKILQLFVFSHRKECTKKLRGCDKRLADGRYIGLWVLKKTDGVTDAQKFEL